MVRRVVALGALGTVATAAAAAVVVAPGLAGSGPLAELSATLAAVDPRTLLLVASLLLGLVVAGLTWRAARTRPAGHSPDAFDETAGSPPESVTAPRQALTAADLDAGFDRAVAGDDGAVAAVDERLRDLAARAYARADGCDDATAQTAVQRGTWTDDPTAAATLAGPEGPVHPIPDRLRLWLDPESERERRYRRVLRAATSLAGDRR